MLYFQASCLYSRESSEISALRIREGGKEWGWEKSARSLKHQKFCIETRRREKLCCGGEAVWGERGGKICSRIRRAWTGPVANKREGRRRRKSNFRKWYSAARAACLFDERERLSLSSKRESYSSLSPRSRGISRFNLETDMIELVACCATLYNFDLWHGVIEIEINKNNVSVIW